MKVINELNFEPDSNKEFKDQALVEIQKEKESWEFLNQQEI